MPLHYITIHLKTIYSGLSKGNFKDHYGDVVITHWWATLGRAFLFTGPGWAGICIHFNGPGIFSRYRAL